MYFWNIKIWSSSINIDRHIFCQLISIVEDDYDINLEFNFELFVYICGTWVSLWKQHIAWNFNIIHAITVSYLDILNFSRVRLVFKSLNSNKLYFDWFYLKFWVRLDDVAIKRLHKIAIYWSNLTKKSEFRNCFCRTLF